MVKFIAKELLQRRKDVAKFPAGLDFNKHIRISDGVQAVAEFITADTFAAEFYERQQYEVDAGRDEEPVLYGPIYNEIRNSSLPRHVNINVLGPAGVVFDEIKEGGEVKFITVGESTKSVTLQHWGVGLEYTKDLFIFNEQWSLPLIERQVGIAHNALLNHIHLNPIISYGYGAANQTPANTDGASVEENYVLTLENAITAAKTDTSNPRRGPYVLLISSSNMFMWERAFKRRLQDGIDEKSSAQEMIRSVIAYDGWTGTRGHKSTTYSGVTANKAYLISLQYQGIDFQSYVKQDLERQQGEADMSRFILGQDIWDTYRGVYANPLRSVEEITLPTTA